MKDKKSESIRARLLGPLLILLVIQAAVIAGTVLFGGVSVKLKNNEIQILNQNTENTRLSLEKETLHHWAVMLNNSVFVSYEIEQILKRNQYSVSDISKDYILNRRIVEQIISQSIDMLHMSYATGVYCILDGPAAANSASNMKAGFYIRSSNPGGYLADNSSLLMERGLPSVAEQYNIPLDSFWEIGFEEGKDLRNNDFYQNPLFMARQTGTSGKEAMRLAYLSPPFRLSPKDIQVITYSVPVILEDGTVVGVWGLEMTLNQLKQILAEKQTNSSFEECWLLGIRNRGTNTIKPVVDSGYLFNQYFNDVSQISYTDSNEKSISEIESSDGTKWYASIKSLDAYANNGVMEDGEWVLVGMARQNDLLAFYNAIRRMLLSAMLVPILFSLLGAFVIGRIVTDPIRNLAGELKGKSGNRGLALKRVRIREIDDLTEIIEQLSHDVEQSSSKISGILRHANVMIGVFEYSDGEDQVFCSQTLFEMLGWGNIEEPYRYLEVDQFESLMEQTFTGVRLKGDRVFQSLEMKDGTRWVQIILDESKEGTILGVCSDVTADVKEKEKLEWERNFDLLTELYNRRAFREQVEFLMRTQKEKYAAVIMWDLDNLKYINDTYGHDEGDRYLILFAGCLKNSFAGRGIIARYSGDEFVTYLLGDDKEKIRRDVRDFVKRIQKEALNMEGGYLMPVRVSGGLSWYPDDAGDFETLFNYADFAMYMVKHSVKGKVREFDHEEYSHNSYMLTGSEELNRMLETRNVSFVFQPIVTRDGNIFGYELLMRPHFTNLKGITEVLNLARSQAKLSQIESLTWFAGLKAAEAELKKGHLGETEKLFINSIASVCITSGEQAELEAHYHQLLSRIVIEMTEGEPASQEFMERKMEMAKKWRGQTAVDDFGTGYNSESVLLHMRPEIVKMDMSLVRQIHKDKKRQMILKNLLDFAAGNEICVLAEGVETEEELVFLLDCGVYLFQGYYIARPQIEIRPLDPYIAGKMKELAGKS
ncbi:EAL domain-containing protein [Clostridium boliviensis]|uniref:EAL domain-containing protein n=1 Tax=Clostridium boliviensis TaxID=318465 RepID=A0ABU4GN38_9CLOT|nr:EAL domain-containing protein [Clostridium boliviensis]MDW2799029.1 EAL domain-containing protein [Clostridium boliviensis]